MLNSPLLSAALGLVLTYALLSVLVSSLLEAGATILNARANSLLSGIKSLLNDADFNELASALYNHALVNPLSKGNTAKGAKPVVLPSYIDANNFALALLDGIGAVQNGTLQTNAANLAASIKDPQISAYLTGVINRANGKLDVATAEISHWFDASMDRLSGKYKRNTQWISFLLALAIAAGLNMDSIRLFRLYWAEPVSQTALKVPDQDLATYSFKPTAASGSETAASARNTGPAISIPDEIDQLNSLPVGWADGSLPPGTFWGIASFLAGSLLTAISVLFGAPFWFGLLQNLVNIRGTGNKPGSSSA